MIKDRMDREKLLNTLINLRLDADISQRKLAKLMETSQSAISELERNKTDPRISTLQRYARALGYEVKIEFAPSAQPDSKRPNGRV